MYITDRIEMNPKVMMGKPVIRGNTDNDRVNPEKTQ